MECDDRKLLRMTDRYKNTYLISCSPEIKKTSHSTYANVKIYFGLNDEVPFPNWLRHSTERVMRHN